MTSYELADRFAEQANSQRAEKMAQYMRNQFKFYGIQTPERKKIYRDIIKQAKQAKVVDWALLRQCYLAEHREMQYFVVDYLQAMQAFLTYDDLENLFYFVKNKQWWDTIDGLDRIIGSIGLKDSRLDQTMLDWSLDEDFWVRRIAIDHQLLRKEQTKTELLAQIIRNNFGQTEFFINKAIGWSLREYSKTNPQWVRAFLAQYHEEMSKLSVKEASKYV